MVSRHSRLARGLEAAGKHINLEGARFGRMFPHLAGATYGRTRAEEYKNLEKLAAAFEAWREALKPTPLDPDVERALRTELADASRITFLVKQSLLLAEAALLAEPAVREESCLFEKPRRRATKPRDAYSSDRDTSSM